MALAIAALLPLGVGLVVLMTAGLGHLAATEGRLHAAEARTLSGSLELAVESESGQLRSWLAADPAVLDFLATAPAVLPGEAAALDAGWEALPATDPQVRAVLENPAAASLTRYHALHPRTAEILVADVAGHLVAANRKTSDYDQSDEYWWTVGKRLPDGGVWADALHLDESAGVFSLDLVLPLFRNGKLVGVAKLALDVSPLLESLKRSAGADAGRIAILLPDGRLLQRAGMGQFRPGTDELDADSLLCIRVAREGWTAVQKGGAEFLAGFAAIQSPTVDRRRFEPGGYILFLSPRAAVIAPLRRQVLLTAAAAGLATGLCVLAGYALVNRKILRPVGMLGRATRALAETVSLRGDEAGAEDRLRSAREDLDRLSSIRTGDEVEQFAADFTLMTGRVLRHQQELESEVLAKTALLHDELEMAREFQHALLPSTYPDHSASREPLRLGFAHFYQPASTVGGDFFDLIELDDHRTGVLIADVMGHGARSALITAILRAVVRNHVAAAGRPALFLGILNRELHDLVERSGQTLFVTAFFMVVDTRAGLATWATAGHPAPLRARRSTGNPPQLLWDSARQQPALGLLPDATYQESESSLRAGDVFLLYTDGVIEAENPAGKNFGLPRLLTTFDEALDGPLAAMPAKIICEVAAFQKRRHHDDDVCVVAIEVQPGMSSAVAAEPRMVAAAPP